jgi:ADP-ribosylglycohydrolase
MKTLDRMRRVAASAVWSAYADALGFITELTDRTGLRRRIGTDYVERTIPWKRRVGGQYGIPVLLPAGTYSDDTQLRLATSRAIRPGGEFDVEAFAKVELPVWNAYALGAGRSSKTAASNLSNSGVTWFSNFYNQRGLTYMTAGGNGAAMRIQPHVWCAPVGSSDSLVVLDVIRNSICTHGHPRALVGAAFHALVLRRAIDGGAMPSWHELLDLLLSLHDLPTLMIGDAEIRDVWLPSWERRAKDRFDRCVHETVAETEKDFQDVAKAVSKRESYQKIVAAVGGFEAAQRGSGVKTALLAVGLAERYASETPNAAIVEAANALNSDTDSIASMAGALLGAISGGFPDGVLLDRDYIERESMRLARIAEGEREQQFIYPDLFSWKPPKTQLDVVEGENDDVLVAGLGPAQAVSAPIPAGGGYWQFLRLQFGQTIIVKRRKTSDRKMKKLPRTGEVQYDAPLQNTLPFHPVSTSKSPRSIDELTAEAIRGGFDAGLIGAQLLELADGSNGIEKVVAYASIIAKARLSRQRRRE